MTKFKKFLIWLNEQQLNEIQLSFDTIEKIGNFSLAKKAKIDPMYWNSETNHNHVFANKIVNETKYKIINLDVKKALLSLKQKMLLLNHNQKLKILPIFIVMNMEHENLSL